MELWSGGAYKATLHRVVFPAPPKEDGLKGRYSVTYFVQPDDDVVSVALSSSLCLMTLC